MLLKAGHAKITEIVINLNTLLMIWNHFKEARQHILIIVMDVIPYNTQDGEELPKIYRFQKTSFLKI